MGQAEQLAAAREALIAAAGVLDTASEDTATITHNALTSGDDLQTNWQGRAPAAFMSGLNKLAGDSFNLALACEDASGAMNILAVVIDNNLDAIAKAQRISQQVTVVPADVLAQNQAAEAAGQTALAEILYAANTAAQTLADVQGIGACSTGLTLADVQNMAKHAKNGPKHARTGPKPGPKHAKPRGGASGSSSGGGGKDTSGRPFGLGEGPGDDNSGKGLTTRQKILRNIITGFVTAGIVDVSDRTQTGHWESTQDFLTDWLGSSLGWSLSDWKALGILDGPQFRPTKVIQTAAKIGMGGALGVLFHGMSSFAKSHTMPTPRPTVTAPSTIPSPSTTHTSSIPHTPSPSPQPSPVVAP
jgi:hypothetical protein